MEIDIQERSVEIFLNKEEIEIGEGTEIEIETKDLESITLLLEKFIDMKEPVEVLVYKWIRVVDHLGDVSPDHEEIKEGLYKNIMIKTIENGLYLKLIGGLQ